MEIRTQLHQRSLNKHVQILGTQSSCEIAQEQEINRLTEINLYKLLDGQSIGDFGHNLCDALMNTSEKESILPLLTKIASGEAYSWISAKTEFLNRFMPEIQNIAYEVAQQQIKTTADHTN